MVPDVLKLSLLNHYLAHKQHLLPDSRGDDVVQVTRDIVALQALAAHGYGGDPRLGRLLDFVLARQDEQGRWLCGSVSRTWPLEKRNRPSKWVTLDALRLLKTVAG